jgi:dihydropteroate synthase
MKTINCKGQLVDLSTPRVMGILNVTPDSFYSGNRFNSDKEVLRQAEKLLEEGADFIDVGGYSSRPDAADVTLTEELQRVIPAVELILKNFPNALLSIDTFRSAIAQEAIEAGAALVNDISAGRLDPAMLSTVGRLQVPYIMMHMRGTPQTMQQHTDYENLLETVIYYFTERMAAARKEGIHDLIIDPGYGFAKTVEQNFELLKQSDLLLSLESPILVGLSRKSMIYKSLSIPPQEALNGTTVLHTVALQKGASILRVHDVKEAVECVRLRQQLS